MADPSPRTLADQLRSWSDDALARLLLARPDLSTPTPHDSAQLASRAATRVSVVRAVDDLDTPTLTVLEAVVLQGAGTSASAVRRVVHAPAATVDEALALLRDRALVWGTTTDLRPLSVLRDVLGPSRCGEPAAALLAHYGPRRVAALARDLDLVPSGDRTRDTERVVAVLGDPERCAALVAAADPQARSALDHVEAHGFTGTVEAADREVSVETARSPIERLLAHGLLVARDSRHVVVPAEVVICLRGGHTTRESVAELPEVATSERAPDQVDAAAAGAAYELVRHVDLLLETWGAKPPTALRQGGLGVRELKTTAELLHVSEPVAALLVETASAAGLLAVGDTDELDAAWLPTDAFDHWQTGSVAEQWSVLAAAWLSSPRLSGLVGGRDPKGKPVNALAPDLERAWLVETRRATLHEIGTLPAGTVLAAGTGIPSLVERLRWRRPRRPAQRATAVSWVVDEAAALGVVGLGGLSTHGRALLDDPDQAAAALEPRLPATVDHVLLQADLTAVAPGPLEPELAAKVATVADVESRGGATVYRFTASSVRRAFDSGWSAGEVHDFIASASRTPVPQPLVYLVDDVARRFGTLRVGTASSFLRSDDAAALAELLHSPRAAALRLRLIAPTVVVSDVPVDVLLLRLRELGAAPVVEAADGTVRLARRESHRARVRRRRGTGATTARAGARVAAVVSAVRAGDRAAESRPTQAADNGERTTPASVLATLRESVESRQSVWIGYVDNHGSSIERVVDPVRVDAGWLTAFDHRSDDERTFAIHRITGVRPLSAAT